MKKSISLLKIIGRHKFGAVLIGIALIGLGVLLGTGLQNEPALAAGTVTPTLIPTRPPMVMQGYPVEATPFPEELLANREQTFGITIGSVALVIIVVIGTLIGIRWRKKDPDM